MEDNIEYPQEVFSGLEENSKEELITKLDLIKEEKTFKILDYTNYYFGGMRYIHTLVSKLSIEDKNKFWKEFNISDFISEINNVNNLTKILSKSILNLDVEVEVIHLLVKDYFKNILNKINI